MQHSDPLYFPRATYAKKLLTSLHDGITHAFTLFAPRRMGKTQFLLQDIAPMAEQMGFNVFYFSFMDDNPDTLAERFQTALYEFATNKPTEKAKTFFAGVKKIAAMGVEIERNESPQIIPPISNIISHIANDKRQTLLLLDEVQELARASNTQDLIRSLRTGLDINQNQIKTIFTGSSTNGLKAIFNDSKAPFFHFAHSLDFPTLGQDFTDFLASIYEQRTGNITNKAAFYQVFERLQKTPMYMRAIVQDMIVNPVLSLEDAANIRLEQMQELSDYSGLWAGLKPLDRVLLADIASGNTSPYTSASRTRYAEALGIDAVSTANIQGCLRRLERQDLVTRDTTNALQINSTALKTWILGNIEQ